MSDRKSLRVEVDEQRCLIEKQQVQIRRLTRHVEVQAQHTIELQTQLDLVLRRASPSSHPQWQSRGNGHGRHAQAHPSNQTISSDYA
jgi:hypothetical protein